MCDLLGEVRWQLSGRQFAKAHADLPALLSSRPFLEGHVRERLTAMHTVRLRERTATA